MAINDQLERIITALDYLNKTKTSGYPLSIEDRVYTISNQLQQLVDSGFGELPIHVCTAEEYDPETGIPTVENPEENTFYLVPNVDPEDPNMFMEYIYTGDHWELFGSGGQGVAGVGIASVAKTGTNGKIDTYTITYTDGTTTTFQIANGADGANVTIEETLVSGEDYSIDFEGTGISPVESVAGKTGVVVLDGGDIGYNAAAQYSNGTIGKTVQGLDENIFDLQQDVNGLGGNNIPLDSTDVQSETIEEAVSGLKTQVDGIIEYGYNLIPYETKTTTVNNVTISLNDGVFTLNGTANNDGGRKNKLTSSFVLPAGNYYLSCFDTYDNDPTFFIENDSGDSVISSVQHKNDASFTLQNDTTVYLGCNFNSGNQYNGAYRLQIVSGSTIKPFINPSYISAIDDVARSIAKSWAYALDGVLCIGDSLTAGANYTGSFAGNKIDQNYPRIMGRMLSVEVENGGVNGITTKDWYNNEITKYDLSAYDTFIIWLGTNGGFTDTLDVDVDPYNDYADYADTNTGNYCKIIEKIKNENDSCLIILSSLFVSSGDLAISNKVIRQIAERYSLPIVDNSDLTYQLYPQLHGDIQNVHFSKSGNIYLANRFIEFIEKYIANNPIVADFGETVGKKTSVFDELSDLKTEMGDINTATSSAIGKALSPKTVTNGKVTEWQFKSIGGGTSADLFYVTPEEYGAVGDGVTDDSQAVQDACDAGYAVYFASNKTYYLDSAVIIDHDCYLFGGENSTIKTKTKSNEAANKGIVVSGTIKTETTLTTDYVSNGGATYDNASNRLTLADMSNVAIGDIITIEATDQYYAYSRPYYYLGGTFKVVDIYDGHLYIDRSMPFDITLTENVSVIVYSAPIAHVHNLCFVSDLDSLAYVGSYNGMLELNYCKDSVISQCSFSYMKHGIRIVRSVNTKIEGINLSKSRFSNTSEYSDGFAIEVGSCNNTVIKRIVALCSENCISLGGSVPNFDTYISESKLASECRAIGVYAHENSYNLTIVDCVVGGVSLQGPSKVVRCQFIRNIRVGDDTLGITYYGSHDPRWANLQIKDCTFSDTGTPITLTKQVYQNGIQPTNNIIDYVLIEHCSKGRLSFSPSTDANVLSNTVNRIVINDWIDATEIYHTPTNKIKDLVVKNSTFTSEAWINKHTNVITTEGIDAVTIIKDYPIEYRLIANSSIPGGRYTLPAGTQLSVSSNNQNALYISCGENCASTNNLDYGVGSVSGSSGSTPTITDDATKTSNLTTSDSKLVYTQVNNTTNAAIHPLCMLYAKTKCKATMSATIKNTGATETGSGFRAYILIVDADTGKITYRGEGTSKIATAAGETITHTRDVPANSYVMCYYGGYSSVANAQTTFEDMFSVLIPINESTPSYSAYVGNRRVGDGTLQSVGGVNNIMSTERPFNLNFDVYYDRAALST